MNAIPVIWRGDVMKAIWQVAQQEARHCHHPYLGAEHLLLALTRCEGGYTARLLERLQRDPGLMRDDLRETAGGPRHHLGGDSAALTPRLRAALAGAMAQWPEGLGERELLVTLLGMEGGVFATLCEARDWPRTELLAAVQADDGPEAATLKSPDTYAGEAFEILPAIHAHVVVAQLPRAGALEKYGRDLTAEARAGTLHEAFGRKELLANMARVLTNQVSRNPVLVGDAGVGKTALVEGLAWRLVQADKPINPEFHLENSRIIEISMGRLTAGTQYRGSFEERLQSIIDEACADPNVILFLDELHLIVGGGRGGGAVDAAQLLKPALARETFRCIGATTAAEYDQYIAADPALARRFERIEVPELSAEAMLDVLYQWRPGYQDRYKVSISDDVLADAVRLSVRYMPTRRLPEKAFKVLDNARVLATVGDMRLSMNVDDFGQPPAPAAGGNPLTARAVTQEHVLRVVTTLTGVPVRAAHELSQRLLDLPYTLRGRVIGQNSAVNRVSAVLQSAFADIHDPRRPRAILLFCGPTGVGKTELANAIATEVCGQDHLRTFDMAEFSEKQTVSRLIGSPPGLVGYEEGGELTDWLQRYPQSVVLLDEIEKADPQVLDLLLGVYSAGRLTDGRGREVSAREAIFIMTSNIALSPAAGSEAGASDDSADRRIRSQLREHLRTEFVARIDEVVMFQPLDESALQHIVRLRLEELSRRLQEARQVVLRYAPEVSEMIVREGTTPQSGAREIAATVRRLVAEPLSRTLLNLPQVPGIEIEVRISQRTGMIEAVAVAAPEA